jgi:hypothetical protein
VDENRMPIPGSEIEFDCDTILLSVGLIPENELSRQAGVEMDPRTGGAVVYENRETSLAGVFACGNVLHVHDLADFVTLEGELAGRSAARFAMGDGAVPHSGGALDMLCGEGVSYVVPQRIRPESMADLTDLYFRPSRPYGKSAATLRLNGKAIARYARDRLFPGEMEKLSLPRKLLDRRVNHAAGALVLSIEEVGE